MQTKQISTSTVKQPARKKDKEMLPAKRSAAPVSSKQKQAPVKATPLKVVKAPAKTTKNKLALPVVQEDREVIFDAVIVGKMKNIIASYTDQPEMLDSITSETNSNFTEVLNIDSVDVVEIIIDTEKEFGITIEDDEIKNLKTFKLLYLLVEGKIQASNN